MRFREKSFWETMLETIKYHTNTLDKPFNSFSYGVPHVHNKQWSNCESRDRRGSRCYNLRIDWFTARLLQPPLNQNHFLSKPQPLFIPIPPFSGFPMVLKIHIYTKNGKIKRVELTDGGSITIRLDPQFVDMRRKILYNPISNMMLHLHPDLVVYHYR